MAIAHNLRWPYASPAPGSDAALAEGCTCAVLDNSHGRGRYNDGEKYGWWISAGCPLHGTSQAGERRE